MRIIVCAFAIVMFVVPSALFAAEPSAIKVPASGLGKYWRNEMPLKPAYSRLAIMMQMEGCFVAAYKIDEAGNVRDARIVYQNASIPRANRDSMRGEDLSKLRKAAFESQADEIIKALNALKYLPAASNAANVPVLTRTPPIIVSILSLEKPNDAKAVAQARAAYEERRKRLFETCASAQRSDVNPE